MNILLLIVGLLLMWGGIRICNNLNEYSVRRLGVEPVSLGSATIVLLASAGFVGFALVGNMPLALVSLAALLTTFVWTVQRTDLRIGSTAIVLQLLMALPIIVVLLGLLALFSGAQEKKSKRKRKKR